LKIITNPQCNPLSDRLHNGNELCGAEQHTTAENGSQEVEGARDVFQIEMKWKYPVRGAIG